MRARWRGRDSRVGLCANLAYPLFGCLTNESSLGLHYQVICDMRNTPPTTASWQLGARRLRGDRRLANGLVAAELLRP